MRSRIVAVVALATVLSALEAAGSSAGRSPGLVAREFVTVVHLDPNITLTLNVVSGRLAVSTTTRDFQDPALVAIETPHGTLYRYTGGVPGWTPAGPVSPGEADVPATLPAWGAPARIVSHGRLVGIRLSDGRRIGVRSDRHGRAVALAWPADGGGTLHTTVRYRGALTTISDPFGTARTYQHDKAGHAFELVPRSWRGPGYRHYYRPVLDDPREITWIQHRTIPQAPKPRDLLADARRAAGTTFAGDWYDADQNGGYYNLAVTRLSAAGRINRILRRDGLLDIVQIQPARMTARTINATSDRLTPAFGPALDDCHLRWSDNDDVIDVEIATTITPQELAIVMRELAKTHAWAVIHRDGTSECATFV